MVDTAIAMDWRVLLEPDVQRFIAEHEQDDVAVLALKKGTLPIVLDQIRVRQKARIKTPDFYDTKGFIFPAKDVYEQASSRACALYKASLVSGESFVDLTAGCGVDGFHIARRFEQSVLIEQDEANAALLEYNAQVLGLSVEVRQGSCEDYFRRMYPVDMIYIDPQRRDSGRKGLYDFSLCSPDVMSLLPVLREKAVRVMVKASPFLDIEKGMDDLSPVHEVHVVEWRGECKEVLYLLNFTREIPKEEVVVRAVCLDDIGRVLHNFPFTLSQEKKAEPNYDMPRSYIYEPGPAFQKAGGFQSMAAHYGVSKLHKHTHLYTSDVQIPEFPGKCYKVINVLPVKAKGLGLGSADLALRNFPDSVQNLRKKLKLSDGGAHRIYATTLCDDSKKLILCEK